MSVFDNCRLKYTDLLPDILRQQYGGNQNIGPYKKQETREILKNGAYSYNPSDLLGKGGFGFVYRGIVTDTSEEIAIKIITAEKISKHANREKLIELIQNEIES